MITIRPTTPADDDAIVAIFREVVVAGETFAFPADMPRADVLKFWTGPPARAYVAELDGLVVGSSFIKPNQPDRGSHVANGGFMVAEAARGRGVGRALGEHAIDEARQLGFRAMQFNFVVATNPAVKLWRDLGFAIVGTLPGAFRHPTRGFVDVHVMYRELGSIG
jgi:GNAT superfamily N-acetyltransferase